MKNRVFWILIAGFLAVVPARSTVVPGAVNGARITPDRVNALTTVIGSVADTPDISSVLTSSGSLVIQSTSTTATHPILRMENTANAVIHEMLVGGAVVLNEQGGAVNFRVESDNMANAILVDGTNDFVGINDASPDAMLDVIARNASSSGTVITAAASTTADYLSLRTSAEAAVFRVASDGDVFMVGTTSVTFNDTSLEWHDPDVAGLVGQIYTGGDDFRIASGNNRNVRIDNDTRTVLFISDTNGFLGINDTSPDSMEDIVMLNASSSGTVITAAASQTADLFSVRNSAESPLVQIDSAGLTIFSNAHRAYSRTIAQLVALTPAAVGEVYYCNNCSPTKLVVSTGTAVSNFAAVDGTGFQ